MARAILAEEPFFAPNCVSKGGRAPAFFWAREQEIEALDRGLDALERTVAVTPVGYRAPMWDLSWRTPELLAERGFLYDSSLMDSDIPYELRVDERRSLVEIPIQWALDDWEQYCYLPDIAGSGVIEIPAKARELWQAEFDALREVGGCWVLTNHPFLSGRPSRARELGRLMEHVTSCDDVWVTTLGDIAQHVRGLALSPRSVARPQPERGLRVADSRTAETRRQP